MTATLEIPDQTARDSAPVDACGTRLRLRALAAIGHSDVRIGRALSQPAWRVTRIMNLQARTVSPELRADVVRLFNAWWDKRPPERTRTEARAAKAARERAQRGRWCTGAGLDDHLIDVPGYRPRHGWLPALGTGTACDDPLGRAS
jgi:hypothetical protein